MQPSKRQLTLHPLSPSRQPPQFLLRRAFYHPLINQPLRHLGELQEEAAHLRCRLLRSEAPDGLVVGCHVLLSSRLEGLLLLLPSKHRPVQRVVH